MRLLYRVRQFLWAIHPKVDPGERATIERLLTPAELMLFNSMTPALQRHSLNVLGFLMKQGQTDENLLRGALLHDVGKGRIGLFSRVLVVVLETIWPDGIERLASEDETSWRYGLYSHFHHCRLGAKMARDAGSQESVTNLILNHHRNDSADPQVRLLRVADEAN